GRARARLRVENARERIDDVLRNDLAPVVELRAAANGEGPHQPVARRPPELRERRHDRERVVVLHETIEDLLRDGQAVHVADTRRIEGLWVVTERPPIDGVRGVLVLVRGAQGRRLRTQERGRQKNQTEDGRTYTSPPHPEASRQRSRDGHAAEG